FLYAASNLGSLGGLLAYPVLVEPLLRLRTESYVWAGGYATLVILMAACAAVMWRSDPAPGAARDAAAGTSAIPWRTPLRWRALAAVPASLLVSVTGWITTDFAIPLLWVVPLAIYLATFVLTFAQRPIVSHGLMVRVLPFAIIPPLLLAAGHVLETLDLI